MYRYFVKSVSQFSILCGLTCSTLERDSNSKLTNCPCAFWVLYGTHPRCSSFSWLASCAVPGSENIRGTSHKLTPFCCSTVVEWSVVGVWREPVISPDSRDAAFLSLGTELVFMHIQFSTSCDPLLKLISSFAQMRYMFARVWRRE